MESLEDSLRVLVGEGKMAQLEEDRFQLTDKGREYAKALIQEQDEFAALFAYLCVHSKKGESRQRKARRMLTLWQKLMAEKDQAEAAAVFMGALEIAVLTDPQFAARAGRFLAG